MVERVTIEDVLLAGCGGTGHHASPGVGRYTL
jgi:hypothetical protein